MQKNTSDFGQLPTQFTFWDDPGHGWLEVPYQALVQLGIARDITGFSYRKDDTCYLEKDVDAPLFAEAWLKARGYRGGNNTPFTVHLQWEYRDPIFIRSLPGYRPDAS